ncbi:MAG: HAMP domain-containing histidine kinase [Lachnospiraceae bacterium]|nr:HAMP domain-containing histidine kinase [Lachnospiraceae bacterium]
MKRTIYVNFILGYILFGLLGFLAIYFLGYNTLYKQVLFNNAKNIYDDTYIIAEEYIEMVYESRDYSEGFSGYLSRLTDYLGFTVDVIDQSGNITYSSDPNHLMLTIGDFDPGYFGSKFYTVGTLYDFIPSKSLIVTSPIVYNYSTSAYIIAYVDHTIIHNETLKMVDRLYMLFSVVFLASFIILIIFHFEVYRPIRKIKVSALEYAKGNFSYEGSKIKTKDEIGELATSIDFMAAQFKDLEEDEKKFIANVSHDFRSPLTSIKGYLEAMIDGTIPPELQEKYLNIVLTETERLTKLTNNLLTLNSGDNAPGKLDLTDFDINQTIKETLASFEGQCNRKNIRFDVIYGEISYFVNADKEKIQQVLYNLVDNALKFSSNGSTIYINVSDRYEKVFISVKDTGIGIPKDSLSKIWERFYKSDNSRGKDKSGTGLGLSIVKEIVTNHGENINVISTEGVGTEFIFTLPRSKK